MCTAMDAPGSEPHCRNNKFRLWQVLLKAIDRQPYHFGYVFERIEQDGSGVHVYFANGRTERADLLVGCDGFRSSVRAHLVAPRDRNAAFSKLALASPHADDNWHQLRLWFLNRLQEEPLEVGRGAAFLLRLFWPLGYEVVAALP